MVLRKEGPALMRESCDSRRVKTTKECKVVVLLKISIYHAVQHKVRKSFDPAEWKLELERRNRKLKSCSDPEF